MDFRGQAPVVQKLESVIHWINLYPVATGVENDIFLSEIGSGFGLLVTHPHQEFPGVPPPLSLLGSSYDSQGFILLILPMICLYSALWKFRFVLGF